MSRVQFQETEFTWRRYIFGIDPGGGGDYIIGIKLVVYKVTVVLRERRVNET